ncbi:SidA/IucD/PvdA family monooxygenase [Streptacidiphilus sp. ASG 303]|uniref:lysine N(6)-hydroxylase/L-ornithine N(5)-oxygenase family protein n=1 Tax=Streptacidiphilus sp. ASG 303 TaxID=2896847 RepID=UPI001E51CA20|nr:SidA/IucD/PvdA family monooxygenase [Streptacidiphilus sp. ASG 303]MCD0484556.1 SidA/IucD/PvdA family monooxygenase [Streptacidiphilus sp. ASG 303]
MTNHEVEVLAIGAGPSNLALAVAIEESGATGLAADTLILEQHPDVQWQRNLLLPFARSQVSFVKDLVTLRNPRSRFSFLSFLHAKGRLDEFVNLGTFNPFRREISEYLQWVANSFDHVGVRYNAGVQSVAPRRADDGTVTGWRATLADGDTVDTRDLVVGTGRDAHVPAEFAGLPHDRVIHSSQYSTRIAQYPIDRPVRVVVVGAAQSAAEMFVSVHQDLPLSQPTLVHRSVGLMNYQTSKFVNELFFPSFIDEFHASPPEARRQILDEVRLTNYAGLAAPFLDETYLMLYEQKLTGSQRSAVRPMTEVLTAREEDGEVVLELRDRKTGRVEALRCDLVLLGTGYDQRMPAMVRGLADQVGLERIEVNRRYRVDLGEDARAGLYLQGFNEATHGISDSLLSVLAQRSHEITTDLLDRRSVAATAGAR